MFSCVILVTVVVLLSLVFVAVGVMIVNSFSLERPPKPRHLRPAAPRD